MYRVVRVKMRRNTTDGGREGDAIGNMMLKGRGKGGGREE